MKLFIISLNLSHMQDKNILPNIVTVGIYNNIKEGISDAEYKYSEIKSFTHGYKPEFNDVIIIQEQECNMMNLDDINELKEYNKNNTPINIPSVKAIPAGYYGFINDYTKLSFKELCKKYNLNSNEEVNEKYNSIIKEINNTTKKYI